MFGKYLYRLMKYGIIAAVALVVGSTLLSSVADYVRLVVSGDPTPLIGLVVLSTILVYYSERHDSHSKIVDILVRVLVGLISLFLFMVIFLWGYLVFGIIHAIVFTLGVMMYINLVRRPSMLKDYWDQMIMISASIGPLTTSDKAGLSLRILRDFSIYVISKDQFDSVIRLFRSRPHLPMVLTRYEELDVLYIRQNGQNTSTDSLLGLLEIKGAEQVSPLLSRLIVALPIMEKEHGIGLSDYVLVEDQAVVEGLLETHPVRMSIIPHTDGPRIIIPSRNTLGMNVVEIPTQQQVRVVLGKDITHIKSKEEATQTAS